VRGLVGPDPGVSIEVLLEEPDREVSAEFDGPLFPLIEGHELILASRIEHQIEGGCGVGEPSLAKRLLRIAGWGGRVVHGCLSGYSGQADADTNPSYPGGPIARTRLHPLAIGFLTAVPTED
jgi:hypothetical protein